MIVRRIKTLIEQLINLGIDNDDSLQTLRNRTINISYLSVTCFALFLLFFRLARLEYTLALTNLILLLLLGVSFILCYKKSHQTALILLLHYFLIVTTITHAKGQLVSSTIYLSLVPSIATLIINSKFVKVYYLVACISLYTYLNYDNWGMIVTYMCLTLCGYICCTLFDNTLHYIYAKLQETNAEKDIALKKLNEKNEELIMYNDMMGHDLKAPVRNISSFTKILIDRNKDPVKAEFLQIILNSSKSMSALIEDILTYSKINQTTIKKEKVDLNGLIEEQMIHFSYELKNNGASIERSPLPIVWGDGKSLKTIFHNLISNGFKYQPKNKPHHRPTIRIYSIEQKHKVIVYVNDNGIGIEPQFTSQLFTPFRRFHSASQYNGTGLGMTICKKIMEKHQGNISLDHTSPNGTCFKLEFSKPNTSQDQKK